MATRLDMDALRYVAQAHGLWLVENAAEALGSTYKGRPVGGLGDAGILSFYANKLITTGEGGMVVTDDDSLAAKLRLYVTTGWIRHGRTGIPRLATTSD